MRALTILLVAHLVCVLAVPSGRSGAGRIHHPPKKPEGFVTGENLGLSGDEDAPSDSDSQPEGETDGDYEYESDEDDPEEEIKSKIDGWTLKKHDAKKSVEGITLVCDRFHLEASFLCQPGHGGSHDSPGRRVASHGSEKIK